ncbi:MAG: hypothetical protein AAF408_19950, partial [Pseudomonadota bacterium]
MMTRLVAQSNSALCGIWGDDCVKLLIAAGIAGGVCLTADAATRKFEFSTSDIDPRLVSQMYQGFGPSAPADSSWSANVSLTVESTDTFYNVGELVEYDITLTDGTQTLSFNAAEPAADVSFLGSGDNLQTFSLNVSRETPLGGNTTLTESFNLTGNDGSLGLPGYGLAAQKRTETFPGQSLDGFRVNAIYDGSESIVSAVVPQTRTFQLSFGTTDAGVLSSFKTEYPVDDIQDRDWEGDVTLVVQSFGGPVGDGPLSENDILDFVLTYRDDEDVFTLTPEDLASLNFLGSIENGALDIDFLGAISRANIGDGRVLEKSFSLSIGDPNTQFANIRAANASGLEVSAISGERLSGFRGLITFQGAEFR